MHMSTLDSKAEKSAISESSHPGQMQPIGPDRAEPPSPPAGNAGSSPSPSGPTILRPRFLATGGEYFGIWIVNLLLMIVTLGLYYPWARVRKLQFFAGNTDVGGHRLAFTGIAKQMFPGFAIAVTGFIVYSISDAVSPLLGLAVIALFALVFPWLFRAALRFRLARTSWRGLPFSFTASTRAAYAAFAPGFVVIALLVMVGAGAALFLGFETDTGNADTVAEGALATEAAVSAVLGLLMILGVLIGPWLHFRFKRLQHSHYQYAGCQSRFTAGVGAFYGLYLKSLLVGLLGLLVGAAALGLFAGLTGNFDFGKFDVTQGDGVALVMLGFVGVILAYFVLGQVVAAYFQRTLHNLVWSNTRGDGFAFAASLKFWPYFGLRMLNLFLKMVTIGLYTPFAQVAIARMKLDSIALAVQLDLDAMINQAQESGVSATADAAADLFDVDIGL